MRLAVRIVSALAVVAAIGFAYDVAVHRAAPAKRCGHAVTAAEAQRAQQGMPATRDAALRQLETMLAFARTQEAASANEAGPPAALASLELARGQLSGDYADFARADAALNRAFALSPPGLGPHLLRATLNMTVHRLAAVMPDIAAIERYKLPDPGDVATSTALRGDLLFYRGDYRDALGLYDRAHGAGGGAGIAVRLANWWSRMGDPARAATYLDEAECGVGGPQQQLQAFIVMQRGLLAMHQGQWDAAKTAFDRADAIFPGYWAIELQQASVDGLRGDTAGALATLERIARRDNIPEAYDSIAGLLRAEGDYAGAGRAIATAERLWRQRIALFPDAAYGHAVTHFLNFGDPRVALDLAQRDFRARPYAGSATTLASALVANGRPADALRVLAPVLASGWSGADPYIVATEAQALTGDAKAADASRRQALAINPHSFDRNAGLTWLEH